MIRSGNLKADALFLIGIRLRRVRQERRWTLRRLAQSLDISHTRLSRMENGKLAPTGLLLLEWADALGVDIVELYREVTGSVRDCS